MEQLLAQDAALGLPHDALYRCSLTLQLSAFAMPPYLDCRRKRSRPFSGCAALYAKGAAAGERTAPPCPLGCPALRQQDFGLWCRYGRRFQLL